MALLRDDPFSGLVLDNGIVRVPRTPGTGLSFDAGGR
jgi:hypothetical protein